MKLREFANRLDAWGSDLREWPPPDRAAAERLLEHSAEARSLIAWHARFAGLFDAQEVPAAPPSATLLATALARGRRRGGIAEFIGRNWMAFGWAHAAALAACLVLGFAIGALAPPSHPEPPFASLDIIDDTGAQDD